MAHSTSDTAFLTLEKSFPYRGVREHFANVYHFDITPASSDEWANLGAQVWAYEKPMFPSSVQIERGTGHGPGTPPVLVWEYDFPPVGEGGEAGSFTPIATEHEAPGDAAVWIRYGTTQKNTLGKPIYLRNYYHACYYDTTPDTFSSRQKTAYDALGTIMVQGLPVLGKTFRRAGPRGAVAQNHSTGTWITTHTLKARGRRHRITKAELEAAVKSQRAQDVPFLIGPAIDKLAELLGG